MIQFYSKIEFFVLRRKQKWLFKNDFQIWKAEKRRCANCHVFYCTFTLKHGRQNEKCALSVWKWCLTSLLLTLVPFTLNNAWYTNATPLTTHSRHQEDVKCLSAKICPVATFLQINSKLNKCGKTKTKTAASDEKCFWNTASVKTKKYLTNEAFEAFDCFVLLCLYKRQMGVEKIFLSVKIKPQKNKVRNKNKKELKGGRSMCRSTASYSIKNSNWEHWKRTYIIVHLKKYVLTYLSYFWLIKKREMQKNVYSMNLIMILTWHNKILKQPLIPFRP